MSMRGWQAGVPLPVPVTLGGTGASTAEGALVTLGISTELTTAVSEAEAARDQAQSAAQGELRYTTLAALNANLTPVANSVADVDGDGTNNGRYLKVGASGTGSWTRISTATIPALDVRVAVQESILSRDTAAADILLGSIQPDGSRAVVAGVTDQGRAWFAAGVINRLNTDGTRAISDRWGDLATVSADGQTTRWRGALPGGDDGQPLSASSPMLVLRGRDALGYQAGVALALDAGGALRRIGSADQSASLTTYSARYYGLTGSGDESGALRAAHDAAYAAGLRALSTDGLQITALSATSIRNVRLIGPRPLVGTYRTPVTPPWAPSYHPRGDVAPSRHLTRFAAATGVVPVAILGDSISAGAEAMHISQTVWGAIVAKLRRDNPGKTIAPYNRGLGGQTLVNADGLPVTSNWPAWYTDHGRAWIDYVQDVSPKLVVLHFGMNDGAALSVTRLHSVVTKLLALPSQPDVLICTAMVPTLMQPSYQDKARQEGRDYASGMLRTYAIRNGLGLIDIHRCFVAKRDGYDPLDQPIERLLPEGPINLPYTWPQAVSDYTFDFYRSGGWNTWASAGVIDIPLSSTPGNAIRLRINAGVWEVSAQTQDDRVTHAWTATGITSVTRIGASVSSDGYCTVQLNGVEVFAAYVERWGGTFSPRIGLVGDNTALDIQAIHVAGGVPRQTVQEITDREMWGPHTSEWTGTNNYDGNGINHPSARGVKTVIWPVIAATNFAV